eukprot:gene12066-12208_t
MDMPDRQAAGSAGPAGPGTIPQVDGAGDAEWLDIQYGNQQRQVPQQQQQHGQQQNNDDAAADQPDELTRQESQVEVEAPGEPPLEAVAGHDAAGAEKRAQDFNGVDLSPLLSTPEGDNVTGKPKLAALQRTTYSCSIFQTGTAG